MCSYIAWELRYVRYRTGEALFSLLHLLSAGFNWDFATFIQESPNLDAMILPLISLRSQISVNKKSLPAFSAYYKF